MKEERKPYNTEVKKRNYFNPKWMISLFLLAEAGNYALTISEFNKQVKSFIGDIPENIFLTVVCGVVVITLLTKYCVKKLPESSFFDPLRLSCLFIIIGFVVKLFDVTVFKLLQYTIIVYSLPIIALEEIYIIGGIIWFIVLLKTKYKEYSLKELIRGENIRNSEDESDKETRIRKNKWLIWLFIVICLMITIGQYIAKEQNRRVARITIINNSDQPTNGLRIITTASTNSEPSVVVDGVYVPVKIYDFYGIPEGKSISIDFPQGGGLEVFEEYPRYFTVRIEESKELPVEYNDNTRKINTPKLTWNVKYTKTEMHLTGLVIENKHEAVLRIEGNAQDGYSLVYDHDNKPLFLYEKKLNLLGYPLE